jgi:hypothetical protein
MHPTTTTTLLTTALTLLLTALPLTTALPVPQPLNINLGAYSPALVVGDGAISFEGAEEGAAEGAGNGVTEIVNALQGAAVAGAGSTAAAAAAANNNNAAEVVTPPAGVVQAAAAVGVDAPRPVLNDPVCSPFYSFCLGYVVCWDALGMLTRGI